MKICFSTEAVDLDHQLPNRSKRESKYYWDEMNHLISAGGFSSIEIPYEPKWDFGGRSGIPRTMRSVTVKFGTVANYMKLLKENGIEEIGCIHFDPSLFCRGAIPMYFGAARHYAEEAIEFAYEAGCGTVCMSATPTIYGIKGLLQGAPEEVFLQKTAEMADALSEKAEKANVRFCLRNDYWGLLRGEKILDFMGQLQGRVFLDADTAGLSIAGADPEEFIRQNIDKIGAVHFTDTSFRDDQEAYLQALPEFPAKAADKVYRDIGEGSIDFRKIHQILLKAGFDGPVILNCRNSDDVYRSVLRARWYIHHSLL